MQPYSIAHRSRLIMQGLIILALASAIAWLAFMPARAATRLYAKQDGLTNGSCESWQSACSLSYAIAVATSGDEIWVAAGIHRPTTGSANARMATFQLKDGVEIYGGFAMTETLRQERNFVVNLTLLSGDLDGNDMAGDLTCQSQIQGNNAYHVVTGSGVTRAAVLDGFTITAGYANEIGLNSYNGAGMFNEGGSPTLANLIFRCNIANGRLDSAGGGMYNSNSSLLLSQVTFEDNHAASGGGMYNLDSHPILAQADFRTNYATTGAGILNVRSNLTLTSGSISSNVALDVNGGGGGIMNISNSTASLTDVTFTSNRAGLGGGIYNHESNLSLTDVTFSQNDAGQLGGGLYSRDGEVMLSESSFYGNQANMGGGMLSEESTLNLAGVTFGNNTASRSGGGAMVSSSPLTMTASTFNNNAAMYGGGISNYRSPTALINVTFNGNSATNGGGGMENSNAAIALTNVTFDNNHAQTGGGMRNDSCTIDLGTVTFRHNSSKDYTTFNGQGGGIYNKSSTLTMNMVNFSDNEADHGGALYNANESALDLANVTFYNNRAIDGSLMVDVSSFDKNSSHPSNGHGGALYNRGAKLAFSNTTFSSNTSNLGGAIYSEGNQPADLTNVTFISNTAQSGGGLYNTGTLTTTLINVTFGSNAAPDGSSMYSTNSPLVHNTLFVRATGGNNCAGAALAEGSRANLADDETCQGASLSANIRLGIPGSYGGNTLTIPLLPGSAALDSGNNTYCPATDQRGQPRPYPAGGTCDIGAFESQGFPIFHVYLPVVMR